MSEPSQKESDRARLLSAPETQLPSKGKSSQVLFETANGRVVLVGLASGYEWKEHATPNHALVQMLAGECEFQLEGRTQALRQGDLFYMPPALPHSVRARQGTSLLLILFRPEPN